MDQQEVRERNNGIEREEYEESDHKAQDDELSRKIRHCRSQVTVRGLVASFIIGIIYNVISLKPIFFVVLTTTLLPNLNVSAALLAFVAIKGWTKLIGKFGFKSAPFTKQENQVIQTCSTACYGVAVVAGIDTPGNSPESYKEPRIGWMTCFLFATGFVGLLSLVPLRKILIIDYKLAYPSGVATAVLINGFRTPQADKDQIRGFGKFFSFSFVWVFFQWFYAGRNLCGFVQFPTFGLQAWKQSFFFDFSLTYVGAGMFCSHPVNLSTLFGAVLSYGMMWPLIRGLKGEWYPATISEGSMRSLSGYKDFISIALILGDELYNFLKVVLLTTKIVKGTVKIANEGKRKNNLFSLLCYHFSIISIISIPLMFPQLKWYYVVVAYFLAPFLGFCKAYGAGLTDMNIAYNYGKVALFILAAISGTENGLVAGLVGCGFIKSIVSISSDLMHDFKAGQLTFSSPRSMVISQAAGTLMGCIKAFDVGNPSGQYKAPYALIYPNMAILGVQGFSALPAHCLQLCYGSLHLSPKKIGMWVPLPMAMAVPFLVGASFAIDMCIGSLIVFLYEKLDKRKASLMIPVIGSGLMCGEGLWMLPSATLGMAKVKPPICMKFEPA
ncbi:hypothetical protein MKX01_029201 [Papaver californicum]|nr:hypothetical protein MKX01_029201 [Papaver californicum]